MVKAFELLYALILLAAGVITLIICAPFVGVGFIMDQFNAHSK